MKIIDEKLLNEVSAQAKESPRLRMNYNFHRSLDEKLNGWDRINRTVVKIKQDSVTARIEEDYQQIGLLCREVIISLAQAVFQPEVHGAIDEEGKTIGKTDANRMISNYLSYKLAGSSNQEIRTYAKDTNRVANLLTHKRDASRKDMLMAVSATIALINFIGILEDKV